MSRWWEAERRLARPTHRGFKLLFQGIKKEIQDAQWTVERLMAVQKSLEAAEPLYEAERDADTRNVYDCYEFYDDSTGACWTGS